MNQVIHDGWRKERKREKESDRGGLEEIERVGMWHTSWALSLLYLLMGFKRSLLDLGLVLAERVLL